MIPLEVYKKALDENLGNRLTRFYKDASECEPDKPTRELAIMCLCKNDYLILHLFDKLKHDVKQQKSYFKELDHQKMLVVNPHIRPILHGEHALEYGKCEIFKNPYKKSSEQKAYKKKMMDTLWKLFICETRTVCCIACREVKESYTKYCQNESHAKLGKIDIKNYFPRETNEFRLVKLCEECSEEVIYCPICKEPLESANT